MQWIERCSAFFAEKKKTLVDISKGATGEQAAQLITSSAHEPDDAIGFDQEDAARYGLQLCDVVAIAPVDSGTCFISQCYIIVS